MQKYNGTLLRKFDDPVQGNASVGTSVVVRKKSDNSIAPIYSVDDVNSIQKPNPFTTDAFGRYSFFAPNGKYIIQFGDGSDEIEISMVDNLEHNSLSDRNAVGSHDAIYERHVATSDEVPTLVLSAGDYIWVDDRKAPFRVKSGTPNGADKIDAGGGLVAEYSMDFINMESFSNGTDAQKVQAAITYWESNKSKQIYAFRSFDITGSTIYIQNVETENPESQLVFWGGELVKNDSGYMFDKPLGVGQIQSTGGIRFKGTRFKGAGTGDTYVINGHHDFLGLDTSTHILRVAFEGCMGVGIQAVYAAPTGYIQSITFDSNCVWRKWAGYIVDCGSLYDVQMLNFRAEAGDAVLATRKDDADPACSGLVILGGNIEGNSGASGPAIHVGVCIGTTISPAYMESNAGGDIDCSRGIGFHKGLNITGVKVELTPSQLADPNYYPIQLGKGAENAFNVGGNFSNGQLYQCSVGNESPIVDIGSFASNASMKYGSNIVRRHEFKAAGYKGQVFEGAGVSMDFEFGAIYPEQFKEFVVDRDLHPELLWGEVNPQINNSYYSGRKWRKGSYIINTSPTVELRQYGVGIVHNALIKGWVCVESSSALNLVGVWREDAVMLPF